MPNIGKHTPTFICEKLSISSPILGEHKSSLEIGICTYMGEINEILKWAYVLLIWENTCLLLFMIYRIKISFIMSQSGYGGGGGV